jgi:outer membrane lipoprotein-sorting protein
MIVRPLLAGWLAIASLAAHAAFDLDTLMQDLSRHAGGRARFVETRTAAMLDRPLVLHGEMRYEPPHRLEKRTLQPTTETLILDGNTLTVERDQRRMTFNVASRPEAQAFVESIRSTLAGDLAALRRYYRLDLTGTPAGWSLALTPLDASVLALVQRITVSGDGNQVRRVEYLQADGDRAEMIIEPVVGE